MVPVQRFSKTKVGIMILILLSSIVAHEDRLINSEFYIDLNVLPKIFQE